MNELPDAAYDRSEIRIFQSDYRLILSTFADNTFDYVLTDPPYAQQTIDGARSHKNIGKPMMAGEDPFSILDLYQAFEEIGRVAKRWVVSFLDYHHIQMLESKPPEGLRFVRFGIWSKPNGAPQFSGDRPAQGWEGIAILHKKKPGRMYWNGGGHRAVWDVDYNPFWEEKIEKGFHKNQKPLILCKKLMELFSDPLDLVLDPFAGSMTTGVAAQELHRKAVLIERDPRYIAPGIARLRQTPLPMTAEQNSLPGIG